MRLRHIEVFHAVMQVGTISGAAQLLYVTQPAVTKVLQHCEMQLGLQLFVRDKGRLYPTPEARRLFADVDRLHRELQGVRRLAQNLKERMSETVSVISTPALAISVVPKAITQWRRRHGGVQCKLATHHTKEIVNALLLGEAHFGLSLQDPLHPSIAAEAVAMGSMTAIAPAGTWAPAEMALPLAPAGLPPELVGLPDDDPLGARVTDWCESQGHSMRATTSVQTYQLARTLVECGAGSAVIDPFTAAALDLRVAQRRVLAPRVEVSLYVLTPRTASLPESGRHLLRCIRQAGEEALKWQQPQPAEDVAKAAARRDASALML